MKFPRKAIVSSLALALCVAPAFADETEDAISEALANYKKGDFVAASQSLQYAQSLIAEKKGDAALDALPKEINGWKGDNGETQQLGMLGGGTQVSRRYTKGDKSASISVTVDSPLVQQMMGLISNPMFAGQMGRPRKVNGENATYNKENGELTMVVDNRLLVKVEASDATEEEILELAKGINFDELKK